MMPRRSIGDPDSAIAEAACPDTPGQARPDLHGAEVDNRLRRDRHTPGRFRYYAPCQLWRPRRVHNIGTLPHHSVFRPRDEYAQGMRKK